MTKSALSRTMAAKPRSRDPADAGTRSLERDKLDACLKRPGIVSRAAAGFGSDAAVVQALVAALVWQEAAAEDECVVKAEVSEAGEVTLLFVVAAGMLAVFVAGCAVGGAAVAAWGRRRRRVADMGVQCEPPPVGRHSVSAQGPVTYKRNWATPRMQAVDVEYFGAWRD